MPLINVQTADDPGELGVTAIQASHPEGEICPTFTIDCRPTRGNEAEPGSHFTWSPPAELTFSIGEASWICTPGDSPRRLSGDDGVTYRVTYIPTPMWFLRHARYGKHVVWLACPQWLYDQYVQQIDEEDYQLFHKTADVYCSDGFTIAEILEDLNALLGETGKSQGDVEMTFASQLPDFHLPHPSLLLSKEHILLDFLLSLFPPGFSYVWDWQNNTLTVALAEPAIQEVTIPPGATLVEYVNPAVVAYNSVSITGAPYKLNSGITLDETGWEKAVSSNPARFCKIIEETLPIETHPIGNYTQTAQTTRTIQTGPDGNPFAVVAEMTEIKGPKCNQSGIIIDQNALLKTIDTTNTYENNDPVIYQTPRITESQMVSSGYVTKISSGKAVSSNGMIYYLTEALDVLSYTEYQASDQPTVLCSAVTNWVTDYETVTESKAYIHPEDVTADWPEGYETENTRSVQRQCYLVRGMYYACTEDARTVLQRIAQALQQEESPSIGAITTMQRICERDARKVKLESPGSYVFEELRMRYNQDAGRMENQTTTTHISATPPNIPSQYRTEPLKATVGEKGAKLVYSTSGQVPTANPQDFDLWAGKLYYDLIQPRKTMVVTVREYVLPQGYRLGGGTVVGWSASQRGADSQASMTII